MNSHSPRANFHQSTCPIALAISIATIRSKVDEMVSLGERAQAQLDQVMALLPLDAHDIRVALLFDPAELPAKRTFSVYLMGDDVLLVHEMALNWVAPQRHLMLGSFWLGDERFHPQEWDVLLRWDPFEQRFHRVK